VAAGALDPGSAGSAVKVRTDGVYCLVLKSDRPYFKGAGNAVRKLDYDAAGNMAGVDDELEVQAEDPDGDKLTFTWTASNGTVVGEGNKITWKRLMGAGRPVPGVIKIEVSDGRGGKVSSQIAQ
jgi:hypothetical protein